MEVESYAGYKADERPMRLKLDGRILKIIEVEDRWYSPGETYFRVRVEDGDRYVLRHVDAQDVWTPGRVPQRGELEVSRQVHWTAIILLAVLAVLVGRAISVYALVPVSNLLGEKTPARWQHVLVWGGLHGSLSLALALSLGRDFPYREKILALTFGVVAFSIIVQGLTISPLLRVLGLSAKEGEDTFAIARVRQVAASASQTELKELLMTGVISRPVYDQLQKELDERSATLQAQVDEMYSNDPERAEAEIETARMRLASAEKSSIEEAVHAGFISTQAAAKLLDRIDKRTATANEKATSG